MNMRLYSLLVFVFIASNISRAQPDIAAVKPAVKKYTMVEVYDSLYGITCYNNLVFATGGDSMRYDKKGYDAQGWIEDYYTNGQVLHKGYYVDGQLRVFKNFYDTGELERSFKLNDGKRSEMTTFYKDGKTRSHIEFFGDVIVRQTDFFPNGLKEYEEESDKAGSILWKKISYTEDGFVESSLEVIDKKKKTFMQKEYYNGGRIKSEGTLVYNPNTLDFAKEGTWTYYDESGKVTMTENYHSGELLKN